MTAREFEAYLRSSFVEQYHLTNMKLIPTEEYTWDPMGLGPPRPEL